MPRSGLWNHVRALQADINETCQQAAPEQSECGEIELNSVNLYCICRRPMRRCGGAYICSQLRCGDNMGDDNAARALWRYHHRQRPRHIVIIVGDDGAAQNIMASAVLGSTAESHVVDTTQL